MITIRVKRTFTINHKVTGQQRQPIGLQSILDGKKVVSIIATIASGTMKTSNGVQVSANLANAYLQLVNRGNEIIHEALPLSLLDPRYAVGLGGGQLVELHSNEIDWTKSAIIYGDASEATANAGKEIPLLISYE